MEFLSGDGEITLKDAVTALKIIAGTGMIWYDYSRSGADVGVDDRIGLAKVIYILKKKFFGKACKEEG